MSKKTKYPAFSNGSVSINGDTVATTSKDGNTVNTNYNMSETEKNIYEQIFNFSTDIYQIKKS